MDRGDRDTKIQTDGSEKETSQSKVLFCVGFTTLRKIFSFITPKLANTEIDLEIHRDK